MPADPRYDVVNKLAMPGEFYGCHNKPRPVQGALIPLPNGKPSDIPHVMSTDCRYDLSRTDKRCTGCYQIGVSDTYIASLK